MAKQIEIQKSPNNAINQPSADFIKQNFDNLIWQKGYRVIVEKMIKCPCKGDNGIDPLSTCKNCAGTGFTYINPLLTRMILTAMNMSTEYKSWSAINAGTVNVSTLNENRLSYMDKITVVDCEGTFSETRHVLLDDTSDTLFFYTSYNMKSIEYAGLFIAHNEKYVRLKLNEDYTFKANIFYLDSKYRTIFDTNKTSDFGTSITIRYNHPPQYYVIDLTRDVMQSWSRQGKKEVQIELPLAAIARRAHYVFEAENLSATRLLDNSYELDKCFKEYKEINDIFHLCS